MLQPVTIDNQAYICPSWQEMGKLIVSLAKKIQTAEGHFDRVVALAKGGLSWNRQLQDLLAIMNTSSIQVKFYRDINQTNSRPIVIQSIPVTIENESILIFDDVADTGESLKVAIDYLFAHGAKSIQTATVFSKPHTKVVPDFSAFDTTAWIIFPHDAVENMKTLDKQWGVKREELRVRFVQIGLEEAIIDFYLASSHQV